MNAKGGRTPALLAGLFTALAFLTVQAGTRAADIGPFEPLERMSSQAAPAGNSSELFKTYCNPLNINKTKLGIHILMKDNPYVFRVDSFNGSGMTTGEATRLP